MARGVGPQGQVDFLRSGVISDTTPVVGKWLDTLKLDNVSFQLETQNSAGAVGGTLAGSWKVEIANDYVPSVVEGAVPTAGNPIDITADFDPAIPAATSGGQNYPINLAMLPYRYVRVTFTPTSGTGRAAAYTCAKGL